MKYTNRRPKKPGWSTIRFLNEIAAVVMGVVTVYLMNLEGPQMKDLKYSKTRQLNRENRKKDGFKALGIREHELQRMCEQYLRLKNIRFLRFPDSVYSQIFGSQSKLSLGLRQYLSTLLKGVPDLILIKNRDGVYCTALCVELKTEKGKLSQGQKNWAKTLPVHVIRSFDEFQKIADNFLNSK